MTGGTIATNTNTHKTSYVSLTNIYTFHASNKLTLKVSHTKTKTKNTNKTTNIFT